MAYPHTVATARHDSAGLPSGLTRLAFHAPIWLYRAHLGGLMGGRALMLEHTGRKTGKIRRTVLEVVSNRPNAAYVGAAWGWRSDWLRNVRANPHVVVHLGNRSFVTQASVVDEEVARHLLSEYASRHPRAFKWLAHFILDQSDETTTEQVERIAATIPIVELPHSDPREP